PHCHMILRGGQSGANYGADHVRIAADALEKDGLVRAVMVDCSHDQSGKDPERSRAVFHEVVLHMGDPAGYTNRAMLEINLVAGSQTLTSDTAKLVRGQSITDPCAGWEATETALLAAHAALAPRFS